MGTWDATSFGNDTANDWAYGLEKSSDLSFIEATLQRVLDVGEEYLEATEAEEAIAGAEVLAWLRGRPTAVNAYMEKVGAWVKAHPIQPSAEVIQKAIAALDRIVQEPSELLELWEGEQEWLAAVADLRTRLS